MLTVVRGVTLGEASVAITASTLTWAAGSAWQSGRAARVPLSRLLVIGASTVLFGELAVASTLWADVPVLVAYVGWALVGAGMGVAFPTIPLATMRIAGDGQEAGVLSSVLLMDVLGVATGAGLGGGAIALTRAAHVPLQRGLAISFAFGFVALVILMLLARRIEPVDV
jgi:hypothetical protein